MRTKFLFRAFLIAAAFLFAVPSAATIVWEYAGTVNGSTAGITSLTDGDAFTISVTLDETTADSDGAPDAGLYLGAVQSAVFDFGAGAYSFAGAPSGPNNQVLSFLPGSTILEVAFSANAPLDGLALVRGRALLIDALNLQGAWAAMGGDVFPNPLPTFDASLPPTSNVWGTGDIFFQFAGGESLSGVVTSARQVPEAGMLLLLSSGVLGVSGLRRRSAA